MEEKKIGIKNTTEAIRRMEEKEAIKKQLINIYLDFLDDDINLTFEELPIPNVKVEDVDGERDYEDIELDLYYNMCKAKSIIDNK